MSREVEGKPGKCDVGEIKCMQCFKGPDIAERATKVKTEPLANGFNKVEIAVNIEKNRLVEKGKRLIGVD